VVVFLKETKMPNADDSTEALKELNVYMTQGGQYYEAAFAKDDGDARIPFATPGLVAQIRAGYVPPATSYNSQEGHSTETVNQVNSGVSLPAAPATLPATPDTSLTAPVLALPAPDTMTEHELTNHADPVAVKTSGAEPELGAAHSDVPAADELDKPAPIPEVSAETKVDDLPAPQPKVVPSIPDKTGGSAI
jgi:hypothetical protein